MISFPANPVLNQVYTYGTKSWIWVGDRWSVVNISGGNRISVSNNVISADFSGIATDANVAQFYTTNAYVTSNFATISSVDAKIANVAIGNINLSGYATAEFVTNSIANINLSGFATANFVTNAINELHIENYATNAYTTAYIQRLIEINMAPIVQSAIIDAGTLNNDSNILLDLGTFTGPSGIIYDLGVI
jgi:hypothetical protein